MKHSYTQAEIEILREGGKKLNQIMKDLEIFVVPGVTVHDIEIKVRELIKLAGATSATVGYVMDGAPYPFPSAVCVSVNNEVVHGIALNNERVIQEGDLVSADVVIVYQKMFVDICRTWGIGKISSQDKELLSVARKATDQAINQAVPGNTVDDIGRVAQDVAGKSGMTTARELGGHGVGRAIHTAPFIPNFGGSGFKDPIYEGMVLAIEPIVCAGDWRVDMADDGWLFTTADGKKTAQFEETVLVTKNGPEILTR